MHRYKDALGEGCSFAREGKWSDELGAVGGRIHPKECKLNETLEASLKIGFSST